MAYAEVTATLELLPGLPQTNTNTGYSATVVLLTDHLTRADNIINSKIAKRFDISSITTTATPPLLRTLCQDMGSYFHYRSVFSGDNQNVNEWTDKFNEALSILDEIRDGKVDLISTAGSLLAERSTSAVNMVESNTQDYQPFFDEDSATSWKIDDDKKDDISDSR